MFVCPLLGVTAHNNTGLKHLLYFKSTPSIVDGPVVTVATFYASAFGAHVAGLAGGASGGDVDGNVILRAEEGTFTSKFVGWADGGG